MSCINKDHEKIKRLSISFALKIFANGCVADEPIIKEIKDSTFEDKEVLEDALAIAKSLSEEFENPVATIPDEKLIDIANDYFKIKEKKNIENITRLYLDHVLNQKPTFNIPSKQNNPIHRRVQLRTLKTAPTPKEQNQETIFLRIYFLISIIASLSVGVWSGIDKGFDTGFAYACITFFVGFPLFLLIVAILGGLPIFFIALASDKIKNPKDLSILNILKTPYFWLYLLISILFAVAYTDCEYWYYTLLRLSTCAVCVFSAVKFKLEWAKWVFGVLAVLYNPVWPVHLDDKEVWTVANVATALFMWTALYFENKNNKTESPSQRV